MYPTPSFGIPVSSGSIDLFMDLAVYYCTLENSQATVDALRDLTAAGLEPSSEDCYPLLHVTPQRLSDAFSSCVFDPTRLSHLTTLLNAIQVALVSGNTKILRVLCAWHLRNYATPLDRGAMKRLMHVSAASGDSELAISALSLMNKFDYELTIADYYCLVQACILGGDLPGVLEAADRAGSRNVDFYEDPQVSYRLQEQLSKLVSHPWPLDALYYSLVNRKKNGMKVPLVALNACIMAYGRIDKLEKATTTLYEYALRPHRFMITPKASHPLHPPFLPGQKACSVFPRMCIRTMHYSMPPPCPGTRV